MLAEATSVPGHIRFAKADQFIMLMPVAPAMRWLRVTCLPQEQGPRRLQRGAPTRGPAPALIIKSIAAALDRKLAVFPAVKRQQFSKFTAYRKRAR
jgi:hypothetical protein